MQGIELKKLIVISAILVAAFGCEKDDKIVSYTVAKEAPATMPQAAPTAMVEAAEEPTLQWTAPAGWKSVAGSSIAAVTFAVSEQTPDVKCTVTVLSAMENGLVSNINRWENQLGLPPTPASELPSKIQSINVSGEKVDLVDLRNDKSRMLGAILEHGTQAWFVKLVGPLAVIDGQKANFDAFVQSLRFEGHAHQHANATPQQPEPAPQQPKPLRPLPTPAQPTPQTAEMPADHPPINNQPAAREVTWTLPEGWSESPNSSPMRYATIKAGSADMMVSKLTSQGWGNLLDNLNRWRGQVGLPPIDDPAKQTPELYKAPDGREWTTYELTGPERKMVVSYVTVGENVWFFRLNGTADAVNAQSDAFRTFLKTLKFQ